MLLIRQVIFFVRPETGKKRRIVLYPIEQDAEKRAGNAGKQSPLHQALHERYFTQTLGLSLLGYQLPQTSRTAVHAIRAYGGQGGASVMGLPIPMAIGIQGSSSSGNQQ